MVADPVPSIVLLPPSAEKTFRALILKNTPEESCALLFGTNMGYSIDVTNIVTTENMDHSTVSFSIDPEFIYSQILYFEKKDPPLSLIGIFHSHLQGTNPSSKDREFMRLWPVVWVIGSLVSNELVLNAYFPKLDDFEEVQIQVSS